MFSAKPITRPGVLAVTVIAAGALSACSAGQVSQTAHQVAAVDGAAGGTASNKVTVRDVTIVVDKTSPTAHVKFTAANNDTDMKSYTLASVTVDGQKATLADSPELGRHCLLVADTSDSIAQLEKGKTGCVHYTTATLTNPGFPAAGNVPVSFDFGSGNVIDVTATVSAPTLKSGQNEREFGAGENASTSQESSSS